MVGSQAEPRPGAFVQVGRPSEGLPEGMRQGERPTIGEGATMGDLGGVTLGQVGEKGRTRVAGAGFDR